MYPSIDDKINQFAERTTEADFSESILKYGKIIYKAA